MIRKIKHLLDSRVKPDWDVSIALRYLPVTARIISSGPGEKILEIGSGEFGILPYLPPGYRITGVDVDFGAASQSRMHMVKLSGKKLPFTADSFDTVICIDTLEHMDRETRQLAVSEMVRVTRKNIYLGFPSGKFARISDRILARYYQFTHKTRLPFLTEHEKYVLPRGEDVHDYVLRSLARYKKPGKIQISGNTNFLVWIGMLLLGFSEVSLLTTLYRWLSLATPALAGLNLLPYYRTMIFVHLHD